ncbi:MAG: DUF881 domain-containing protein [Fimbriimonadales bacterium]|nr:DUF881 domain-containing protein [Fimbriimonadales bacterium]MDW8052367.1 DUF881 domain-containing protein [Armatimonadota bacterium]
MSENRLYQKVVFFAIWLVVGMLLGLAFKEQTRIRTAELPSARLPELARAYVQEKQANAALEEQIRQLRQRINELETAFASGAKQAEVLSKSLEEAKLIAGLLDVEGPGIELVLRDSTRKPTGESLEQLLPELYTIHDYDLLRVVNELRQAGAEAISINGQRIVATTGIRCTGPVVYINDVKMASPFVIHAIGDPKTLIGALEMPGGALSDIKSVDPKMVELRALDKVRIPAYSGPTQFRYARPVPPQEVQP